MTAESSVRNRRPILTLHCLKGGLTIFVHHRRELGPDEGHVMLEEINIADPFDGAAKPKDRIEVIDGSFLFFGPIQGIELSEETTLLRVVRCHRDGREGWRVVQCSTVQPKRGEQSSSTTLSLFAAATIVT